MAASAAAAVRQQHPVNVLTWQLYWLDVGIDGWRPRADLRATLGRLLAALVATADHTDDDDRTRPGIPILAEWLGQTERSVYRHLATLEEHGLIESRERGRRLTPAERAAVAADPDQRDRWADRASWSVLTPPRPPVPTAELAPYQAAGVTLLTEMSGRPAPLRHGPRMIHRAHRPARPSTTVTPSPGGLRVGSSPLARRAKTLLPDGSKEHKGAASRPSPTKGTRPGKVGHLGSGRRLAAYPLARELVRSGSIPALRDLDDRESREARQRMIKFAARLGQRGFAGWTVADVVEHIEQAARAGTPIPALINFPEAWVLSRLADADPARPPAQLRRAAAAAAAAAQRARQADALAAAAEQAAAAVPPAAVPAYAAARAELPSPRPQPSPPPPVAPAPAPPSSQPNPSLRGIALARAALAAADARREATPAAPVAAPLPPLPEPSARPTAPSSPAPTGLAQARSLAQLRPPGQCSMCDSTGPDVRRRATTTGTPLMACDQHAAWLAGDDQPDRKEPTP